MYIKQLTKWWIAPASVLFLTTGCVNRTPAVDNTDIHSRAVDNTASHILTVDDMGNVWASGQVVKMTMDNSA